MASPYPWLPIFRIVQERNVTYHSTQPMYTALDNIASIMKVSHAFCLAMHPGHIFFVLLKAITLGQDPV